MSSKRKPEEPKSVFHSEFFDNVDDLVMAKNDAVRHNSTRKARLDTVRKFSNGLAMMTPEEARKANRKEIVNHLTNYSKLLLQEAMFQSMVTGTNSLLEVIVSTGDKERDDITGQRLGKTINEGAIHHKGRFANFWREVSGHIVIGGGVPAVFPKGYGWCPSAEVDLVFPPGTGIASDQLLYCFKPKELTYAELKKMRKVVDDRTKSDIYEISTLDRLIKSIRYQIQNRVKDGDTYDEDEKTGELRTSDGFHKQQTFTNIDAWAYYEVHTPDEGEPYVSETIFTNSRSGLETGDEGGVIDDHQEGSETGWVICHVEKAFPDVFDWLYNIFIDAEIGGKKTTDSLRGVAELMFPSGVEMEDLLNRILEGDKQRALQRFQEGENANRDDILGWDIQNSQLVPKGIQEFNMSNTTAQLAMPWQLMGQIASTLTGAPQANTAQGGELRTQAIERQQAGANVQANRLSEAYNHLDSILETIVYRILAGKTQQGTEGYNEIMWVRKRLEEQGVDFKMLAEREHGRFKYLRVRAKRVIGNGDRQAQVETADWMVNNIQNVEPATRPIILRAAFALRTGDPDLAEFAFRVPETLLNSQRKNAEQEYFTIAHRAPAGMSISPQPEDIHHNHIETHLIDGQALIAKAEIEPWTMLDALTFAGLVQHIGEHIQILISNPATNFEGNQYTPAFQQLVAQASPLVKDLAQRGETESNQLTPKEQADLELAVANLELKATELGVKQQDLADLQRIRGERAALQRRSQAVREINDQKRFDLERQKLEKMEASKTESKTAAKKTAKKTAKKGT